MGSRRGPLLAGLAVAAVVLVVAVTLWKCGGSRPTAEPAESFSFDAVSTSSSDISVVTDTVRGTSRDGYMDWACLVKCREPEGCHADLRLTIRYDSGGADEEIIFHGTIDVPVGARARFGGVQRPALRVDRIDDVQVEVLRTFRPGDPVPTPEL